MKDFATSYGTVLYLDNKPLKNIPEDLLLLRHQDVIAHTKTSLTDAEATAKILAYLVSKEVKGLASKDSFSEGAKYEAENFKIFKPYEH